MAALAVATVYYGGAAFSQGSAKAEASTVIAQAQQIAAAEVLYANANNGAYDTSTGLTGLTGGSYLTAVPTLPVSAASGTWTVATDASGFQVTATITNQNVCTAIEDQVGAGSTQTTCTWTAGTSTTTGTGAFVYND